MACQCRSRDLTDVEGVRSTQGSRIFADRIAPSSDILVKHLEAEGGIVYAMSNTPEFGAGAQTFNEVFGITRNPWNTELTPAGSSGGAAVALATGMAWLAHGSDMGGSLRNPASFCGVVGLRPSPGRVASTVLGKIDGTLGVEGPMARNVTDLALLLDAMSGFESGDPLSLLKEKHSFTSVMQNHWKPKRVAFSRDLGITRWTPRLRQSSRRLPENWKPAASSSKRRTPTCAKAMEVFSRPYAALGFCNGHAQSAEEPPQQAQGRCDLEH